MGYCVSGLDLSLAPGEGTLLTITLNADEDLASEGAEIKITDQELTDSDGTEHPATVPDGEELVDAYIEPVTYPDGYSLQFLPQYLSDEEGMDEVQAAIKLKSPSNVNIKKITFDLVVDKSFLEKDLWSSKLSSTFTESDRDFDYSASTTNTGKHFSISIKRSTYISKGDITNIGFLSLYKNDFIDDVKITISEGVYVITLNNIKLIDSNNTEISIAPYSADIYVGSTDSPSPKVSIIDGIAAFHGDYSNNELFDMLKNAIPYNNQELTTLDLTAVTAVPCAGKSFTLANANALIRTNEDFQLTNTKNVVIGKNCSNLELTDKYAFANTKKFTATNASYTRPMTDHRWGTLCLPFAATMHGANIYTLKEVTANGTNTESSGLMTFEMEATTTVAANKPYVIKKTANNVIFSASNTEVPVTPDVCSEKTDIDNWSLNGMTIDVNFATTDLESHNYYFINSDAFWNASNSLHVAPFRAYFEYTQPEGTAPAKFRITEETNGIETIENEAEAGVIYDLQGRAVKAAQAGQIYVQGAKKFVVK